MVLNQHKIAYCTPAIFIARWRQPQSQHRRRCNTFIALYTISIHVFFSKTFTIILVEMCVCVLLRLFSIMLCYCSDYSGVRMLANILMTMLSILWKVLFCVCDSGAQNVVQKTSNDKSLDLSTLVSITNEHTQSESLNGIANTKYSPFFFLWTPQMKWEKRKRSQRVECLALFWEIFIS